MATGSRRASEGKGVRSLFRSPPHFDQGRGRWDSIAFGGQQCAEKAPDPFFRPATSPGGDFEGHCWVAGQPALWLAVSCSAGRPMVDNSLAASRNRGIIDICGRIWGSPTGRGKWRYRVCWKVSDMARTQDARQVAVATPLGAEALLFSKMVGTEELGRLFQYELTLLSEDPNISLTNDHRAEHFRAGGTVPLDRAAVLQRVRQQVRPGPHVGQDGRVPRDDGALAMVPDPHQRLPNLPGHDGARDHQAGLQRFRLHRHRGPAVGKISHVGVLRPVPRDGLQLRQPADGAGGDLLLLPPRREQAHAGAGQRRRHARPSAATRRSPYRPHTTSLRQEEYVSKWAVEQQVQPGVYSHTDFNFKKSKQSLLSSAKVTRTNAAAD